MESGEQTGPSYFRCRADSRRVHALPDMLRRWRMFFLFCIYAYSIFSMLLEFDPAYASSKDNIQFASVKLESTQESRASYLFCFTSGRRRPTPFVAFCCFSVACPGPSRSATLRIKRIHGLSAEASCIIH